MQFEALIVAHVSVDFLLNADPPPVAAGPDEMDRFATGVHRHLDLPLDVSGIVPVFIRAPIGGRERRSEIAVDDEIPFASEHACWFASGAYRSALAGGENDAFSSASDGSGVVAHHHLG